MSNLDESATPQRILPGYGTDLPTMTPSGQWDWTRVEGGFSKREAAAIALRVPESGDPDLDAMIRTAQRRDLAAQVLAGFGADPNCIDPVKNAEGALVWADALLSTLSHPVAEKEST
jgi:hypothetical protein